MLREGRICSFSRSLCCRRTRYPIQLCRTSLMTGNDGGGKRESVEHLLRYEPANQLFGKPSPGLSATTFLESPAAGRTNGKYLQTLNNSFWHHHHLISQGRLPARPPPYPFLQKRVDGWPLASAVTTPLVTLGSLRFHFYLCLKRCGGRIEVTDLHR
jgi:hypothetical protein